MGFRPSDKDIARETHMEDVLVRILRTPSTEIKRKLWREYSALHRERGAEFVSWLEKQRGINRA